ncbi:MULTISPECIES: tRNA (guanosine(37)-N1)-methyltransferase TrmD [Bacillaceae]|jgi:tRNA (guanine37-N1)-methyltransferase|uniref:tRNA (guanosine(37)-N1)-methyltransferase TrmD n=1 Tax=Bacillaceae TaxID=186817 RepID=UPI000B9B087E|nr:MULTISPECIES: tRNA (guanosine(37)-N1)-methyltransferase TrmD [Bacillus]OXT18679.1 tRNA (guanosine(37)-N1)-methyltransferase TrmD [Bacillus sp. OG2]MCA1034672.1 tRNA (guanosine(37)-N1)-methyltransferase TrmD [Bacillus infantis]MCK6206178.1 tRNA (guanosine(37)-N1)-methyltransferase TrmD [Bacillus infantis]MCP1158033.1 tRNA (guanosine(37)-N1)-methyltransferase TrmD [Bacillus infantis]MDT0159411.1 tRNA (guanosine(37)-N1)-methyltransferase TrmD [Bacillus sp. AG4(2022)]
MMKIDVLTLFPEMFGGVFGHSILKKAEENNAVSYNVVNFRDYADNKHKTVDDYPYGGGAGMVLKPQPIFDAVADLKVKAGGGEPRVVLLCPQGERYTQKKAEELSSLDHLIFVCGHYEGYDERIREHLVTDEISIGDFVLTGGELGAMVLIDSIVRLLPGVLGNEESHMKDSFSTGFLEHPHYTRPADFRGMKVPDILTSGNHRLVDEWRMKESLKRTYLRRPDLFEGAELTKEQVRLLEEIKKEHNSY